MVGVRNGFLPRQDPLPTLPEKYASYEQLLQAMPVTRADGKPGLLATGDFGAAVDKELKVIDVSDITDPRLASGK